jgi:hypothetical protein
VATFSNLVVDTSGSYTFTATPNSITGVTNAVNSSAFTVGKAAPTVTAAAPATGSLNTAIPDSSITSVLSGGLAETGSVTFQVIGPQATAPTTCTTGFTTVGSATVSGNATYTSSAGYTPVAAGDYWWYVSYGGDGNNAATTSACPPTAETVVAKATPTDVVTNSTPTTVGSSITFTATLAGQGVTPTGGVTWSVSGTSGVTACTTSTTILSAGTATCTITAIAPGTYIVSDTYAGDGNYVSVTSANDTASAAFVPNLLQIESKNGGTAGKIQAGDHVGVTFPSPISAATVCPGQTGSFSITGTVTINNGGAPSGNDELLFAPNAGACTGNVVGFASGSTGTHAGYIDLGSNGFVTATATIATSTLNFDATTNNIRITFGGTVTGGGTLGTVTTSTGTYFPDSAIQSSNGIAASGSVSETDILTVGQPIASSIASNPATPANGAPGIGDQIIYTYSEPMDANSLLSGWNGSTIDVEACFSRTSNGNTPTVLTIETTSACNTAINLGTVSLGDTNQTGHYVPSTFASPYTVTATMTMATVGGQSVVTVSINSTNGNFATVTNNTQWTWVPNTAAGDLAGNPVSATDPALSASKENF